MGICTQPHMNCGNACIPTCSDTLGNCSAPFISSSEVGAIYYQISLCCGSEWMEERNGDAFVSIGPMMVWLIATPLLKVIKRILLRSCLSKFCNISDDEEDGDTKNVAARRGNNSEKQEHKGSNKNNYASAFTTINGIVQLFCGAIALWTFFFRRNFHIREVNSSCPESHCRFLIYMAAFLYKPFIVPVYQTVTAATQVIHDAVRIKSSIRNLLFTCHGCLLIPYLVGLFLVFLLPMFVYSIVLLILFFPIYIAIFLLLTIPATIGATILMRNDFTQEARVYSAVNSGYVFVLAFVYSTICVSKLYYGCGWQYTTRALFEDSFSAYTLKSGLSWPTTTSSLSQGTLMVSLASGIICSTLETLIRLSCRSQNAYSVVNRSSAGSSSTPGNSPALEMTIRTVTNRV